MDSNLTTEDKIKQHLEQCVELASAKKCYAICQRNCHTFTNLDFLYSGMARIIICVESGRDFLQFLR